MPHPLRRYNRRTIRLKGHDYRSDGAYFITICVRHHACLFGQIDRGIVRLSDAGEVAHNCWLEMPDHFPQVTLDEFVIMPNHMHGIMVIGNTNTDRVDTDCMDTIYRVHTIRAFGNAVAGSLSTMVGAYKAAVTRRCRLMDIPFKWQPRFYAHIIRNEQALLNIRRYIIENPKNWRKDRFFD